MRVVFKPEFPKLFHNLRTVLPEIDATLLLLRHAPKNRWRGNNGHVLQSLGP